MGGGDHWCEWREKAEGLEAQLGTAHAKLEQTTAALTAAQAQIAEQGGTLTNLVAQL